jgi:hypothetical protein
VQRSTPGQASRALPKAGPARTPHGYYRLRYDHVDAGGKVSIRRAGRMQILLTPHISASGEANMAGPLRQLFADNLRRYLDGRPLLNVVDRARGY